MTTKTKIILGGFGLLLIAFVILLVARFNFVHRPTTEIVVGQPPLNTKVLTVGQTSITVEMADTETTRAQGLSGRRGLADHTGMLFVFDKPGFYGFWMKDMKFSLDMIWIDENWKVVDITKNASPKSFPGTYMSSEPVKYVLEVPAGFTEQNNIKIGDVFIN